MWSAIGALSALLGRKCYIPQGTFTVFPNLYIVLVGDPAKRKSTAMNISKNLLKTLSHLPVAPDSATREALIDELLENKITRNVDGKDIVYHQASTFATELGEFLGGDHINKQAVQFLTSIWDEPEYKERTRKHGKVTIPSPYFTLTACCTKSWISQRIKGSLISDGLTRRIIFVYEDELNTLQPWPVTTDAQWAAWELLSQEAADIHELAGQFYFTKESREVWETFYYSLRGDILDKPEKLQFYLASKHELVLKTAMCISAGVRRDKVIDSPILLKAIHLLDTAETKLEEVYSGIGRNPLKRLMDDMLEHIIRADGKMNRRRLLALMVSELSSVEFTECLSNLLSTGLVEPLTQGDGSETLYRSLKAKNRKRDEHLLESVCQLEISSEVPVSMNANVAEPRVLDLATGKLVTRQELRQQQIGKGILLKGARPGPSLR